MICLGDRVGLDYDALGPGGAAGVERGFAPWYRALLVPMALPRVVKLDVVGTRGASRCPATRASTSSPPSIACTT
jgi:hypothetical protein